MPWTAADARRHTSKADTTELAEAWAKAANNALSLYRDEGRAVRVANDVVNRMRRKQGPIRSFDKKVSRKRMKKKH